MTHPGVRVLLVTGGPAVVREALKSDKRAITAGPGNPPAVVDETADIERAGRDIVLGASFDNNIVCIDEKDVLVVDIVADRLIRAMTQNGAYLLKEHELPAARAGRLQGARPAREAWRHEPGLDRPGRVEDARGDRGRRGSARRAS